MAQETELTARKKKKKGGWGGERKELGSHNPSQGMVLLIRGLPNRLHLFAFPFLPSRPG